MYNKTFKKSLAVFLAALMTLGIFSVAVSATEIDDTGAFNVLVQNVAGLPIPEGYGGDDAEGDPMTDAIQMGRRLGYVGLSAEEIAEINTRIERIDAKIAAYEADITSINGDIEEMRLMQAALLGNIDAKVAQKKGVEDEATLAQLDAEIAELNAQFTANAEQIAVMDAHIRSDESKIAVRRDEKAGFIEKLDADDAYKYASYPLQSEFLLLQEDFNYDQYLRQEMEFYADVHKVECESCNATVEFTAADLASKESLICAGDGCGKRVYFEDGLVCEAYIECPACAVKNYFADDDAINEDGEFCDACGELMPANRDTIVNMRDSAVICPYCDTVNIATTDAVIETNSIICPDCGKEIENILIDYTNSLSYRHGTEHKGGVPMGDGLNTFSKLDENEHGRYAVYNTDRVAWEVASGIATGLNDELTPKGFSVTTVELEDGYYLDIYNIHADAGGASGDVEARAAQFRQLADYIMKHSVYDPEVGIYDHAVIVGGDFNTYISSEDRAEANSRLIENLLEYAHLNDAWAVRDRAEILENDAADWDQDQLAYDYEPYYEYARRDSVPAGYDEYTYREGFYDSVERILYASGNGLSLKLAEFGYGWIFSEDDAERLLSDHPYASATFNYQIVRKKARKTFTNDDEPATDPSRNFLFKFLEFLRSIFRAIGLLFKDHGNINL